MADPRSSSARMIAERLRVGAVPPSSAHPDADLLTAFAERSLNEKERARVVEHLAHCAVCRDVIYLAQPEMEAPLTATAGSPVPIRWFAWRRLQWAALAASLSVVVALAILVREDYQRGSVLTGRMANETTGPQAVAQSQAKNDAPAQISTYSSMDRLEAEPREQAPASAEKQATLKPEAMAKGAAQGSFRGGSSDESYGYFGKLSPGLSKTATDDLRKRNPYDKELAEKDALTFTRNDALRTDEKGRLVAADSNGTSGVRAANGAPDSTGLFDLSPQKVQSGPSANANNFQTAQNATTNLYYVDREAQASGQAASNKPAPAAPAPPPTATGADLTAYVPADRKAPAEQGAVVGGLTVVTKSSAPAPTRPVVPAEETRKKKLETIPAHTTPQGTEETVAVAGKAQDIDAAHAETSGVVAAQPTADLPLNGRNYASLTTLTPGVASTTAITDWRVRHGRLQGRLYGIWHDLILRRQPGAEQSLAMEVSSTSEANAESAESKTGSRSPGRRDGAGVMLRNLAGALQRFTSVAKSGIDVWAVEVVNQGRNVSQLIVHHSRDGGVTWQPSTLTAQETLKSDAEADIRFKDAQQGEIILPTGEKWQTSDGGTHWNPAK